MTDWSSAMLKDPSRHREGLLFRLDEAAREIVAAWFVLLFFAIAGFSILAVHRYSAVDCTSTVATPGMHHYLVADREWSDPESPIGLYSRLQSGQEADLDAVQAAESGDRNPATISSGTGNMLGSMDEMAAMNATPLC